MPKFGEDKLKNQQKTTKFSGTLGRKRDTIVRTQTRMETLPVNRLLLYRGLPIGKRLAILCFHVIIEAFFIGKIGTAQLVVYFLLFPLRFFVLATGLGLATSISEWVPAFYAPEFQRKRQAVLSNALVLGGVGYLVVQLFAFFMWQTGLTQLFPATCQDFGKALWSYSVCSAGQLSVLLLSGYAQAVGRTNLSFRIQLGGLVLEIGLLLLGTSVLASGGIVFVLLTSGFCRIVESLLLARALAKEKLVTLTPSHVNLETVKKLLQQSEETLCFGLCSSLILGLSFRLFALGSKEDAILMAGITLITAGLSFIVIVAYTRALRSVAVYNNKVSAFRRSLRGLGYTLFYGVGFFFVMQILLFFFGEDYLAIFTLDKGLVSAVISSYPLLMIALLMVAVGASLHSFTAAYYQSRLLYLPWMFGELSALFFLYRYRGEIPAGRAVLWATVAFLLVSFVLFFTVLYRMKTKERQVSA